MFLKIWFSRQSLPSISWRTSYRPCKECPFRIDSAAKKVCHIYNYSYIAQQVEGTFYIALWSHIYECIKWRKNEWASYKTYLLSPTCYFFYIFIKCMSMSCVFHFLFWSRFLISSIFILSLFTVIEYLFVNFFNKEYNVSRFCLQSTVN